MSRIINIGYFKIIGVLILFSVLLHPNNLVAQNFKQALLKLRQTYEETDRLHTVMNIQVFKDSLSRQPYYNEKAEIKRDGKNYLYHFGNTEMLMNTNYLVVVDRSSHEIVCSKRDLKGETDFFGKDPIKLNLDSMLARYNEPHYMGKKNTVAHYRIFQKQGPITQVDMKIETTDNVLQSIAYCYKDGQYVKINFEVFDKQPEFKTDTFDEKAYMVFVNGKLKAGQTYRQYNIQEVNN